MTIVGKLTMAVAFGAVAVQHLGGLEQGETALGGAFAPLLHGSRLTRFYMNHAPRGASTLSWRSNECRTDFARPSPHDARRAR